MTQSPAPTLADLQTTIALLEVTAAGAASSVQNAATALSAAQAQANTAANALAAATSQEAAAQVELQTAVTQLAALIAAQAPPVVTPPAPPAPPAAPTAISPDPTSISAGSSGFMDSANRVWTITAAGTVEMDGKGAGNPVITDSDLGRWIGGHIWFRSAARGIWENWTSGNYWGNLTTVDPENPPSPPAGGGAAPPVTPSPPTPPATPPVAPPASPAPVATATRAAAVLAAGNTIPASGLTAVVTMADGSGQYVLSEQHGTNKGPAILPIVTQSRVRDYSAPLQLTVDFGRDTAGPTVGRQEIFIRLGQFVDAFYQDIVSAPPTVADLGALQVDVYNAGAFVAAIPFPALWQWSAPFVWESVPRVALRTPADLAAAGWTLPMDVSRAYGATAPAPVAFTAPLGDLGPINTGLQTAMSSVGGRADIGPNTGWFGDWLLHETPSSLATANAQYLVGRTWPCFFIDDRAGQGAVLDALKINSTAINNPGCGHVIPISPGNTNGGKFAPDSAHMPNIGAPRVMVYDDPCGLEELQAHASWSLLWTQQFSNIAFGTVTSNEVRAWGWSMGLLALCYALSPDGANCPSWLKPKSYWKAVLDANLVLPGKYMASTARVHAQFRAFPWGGQYVTWQVPFVVYALSLLKQLGLTEWKPFYDWIVPGMVAFSSGPASGWGKGVEWIVPYFAILVGPGLSLGSSLFGLFPSGTVTMASLGIDAPGTLDDNTIADHAALYQTYMSGINGAAVHDESAGDPNPDLPLHTPFADWDGKAMESFVSNLSFQHEEFMRGGLALAARDGYPAAAAALAKVEAAFPAYLAAWGKGTVGDQPQWAFIAT